MLPYHALINVLMSLIYLHGFHLHLYQYSFAKYLLSKFKFIKSLNNRFTYFSLKTAEIAAKYKIFASPNKNAFSG